MSNAPNFQQFAAGIPPQAVPQTPTFGQPPAPQGPPPGFGQPPPMQQQPAPVAGGWSPQSAPVAAPPAGAPVFGAGAFAGAKLSADRYPNPVLDRDYILLIGDSWFQKGFKGYGWKVDFTVQACSTPDGSPQGFKTGLYQHWTMGDQVQNDKCIGKLLALCMCAFGFKDEAAYKTAVPHWAQILEAMQSKDQAVNQVGPNPLAGKYVRAHCRGTPDKKNPGQFHCEWFFSPAQ